jgi:hypothetical protein
VEKDPGFSWSERRTSDRRCRRWNLVLHEQRSGFDRRGRSHSGGAGEVLEHTLIGLRDRPRALWIILAVVCILNIADLALTLNVLASGGDEVNPIMAFLFERSPIWAGVFKVAAVLFATTLVWHCRRFRSALAASLLMVVVFAVVLFYHIWGLAVAV